MKINKQDSKIVKIFSKGIWVTDLKEESLWDWSLDNLEINRDRHLPNLSNVKLRIVQYLGRCGTINDALLIVENDNCFEAKALEYNEYAIGGRFKGLMSQAFQKLYGKKAVISTKQSEDNLKMEKYGHSVVSVSQGVKNALTTSPKRIFTSSEISLSKSHSNGEEPELHCQIRKQIDKVSDFIKKGQYNKARTAILDIYHSMDGLDDIPTSDKISDEDEKTRKQEILDSTIPF